MTQPTGFLRHFHDSNRYDLSRYVRFIIEGKQLGWVAKELAPFLAQKFDFLVATADALTLVPDLNTFDARSEALGCAIHAIAHHYGAKLRNEMYPIIEKWGDEPLAQIDRAGVPWFGVRGFGVHVNGFVRKSDGLYLWIGERAANRPIDPGKLDNLIGGGQPIGLSIRENVAKEAQEEAGITAELASTARQVGELRYRLERPEGLRSDTLFVFDLELPESFTPCNTDGEVAAFHLWRLDKVAEIIHDTDRFKFNCSLVIIDFMIRHGFMTDAHPEYATIKSFIG